LNEAKYEAMTSIYEKYMEIEYSGDLRNEFYQQLRIKLLESGHKIQKNTPNAGLLIRLVWGEGTLTASRINQYANVLQAAQGRSIETKDFFEWLKNVKISKASKPQLLDEKERQRSRLERARILILRYLDWRETHPFASLPMYEHAANKYVNMGTQLCVMIGTAVKRFDRESNTADIYISHIMPPNIDIDVRIIDGWAKHIEMWLEEHEQAADEKAIDVWAEEFHDTLWAHDVEVAEKLSTNWMLRQQAAMAQDQNEFAKQAQKFKKERSKSTKTAKSTKKSK